MSEPKNIGLDNQQLKACPNSPNCVCSTESRESHKIDALTVPESDKSPMATLVKVIEQNKRTKIITQTDTYIHATFTTALMRFVDDVEFLLDGNVIQVRSASRVGYSDLGANRKRVEMIRRQLKQAWTK